MNIWQILAAIGLTAVVSAVVIPRVFNADYAGHQHNASSLIKQNVIVLAEQYYLNENSFDNFNIKNFVTDGSYKKNDIVRIFNCADEKSTDSGSNLDSNKNCNYYKIDKLKLKYYGFGDEVQILLEYDSDNEYLRKNFEESFTGEQFQQTTGLYQIWTNADFLSDVGADLKSDLGDETDGKVGFIYKK